MKTGSRGRVALALGVVVVAVALIAALCFNDSQAQQPPSGGPPCDVLFEDPTPGALTVANFPVVVHVMQNAGFQPQNDVLRAQDGFPAATIRQYFDPNGDFNRIWNQQQTGIRFVLVRLETCAYTIPQLGSDLGFTVNTPDIPEPVANGLKLAKRVIDDYNARDYKVNGATKPFQGLDVYVFWDIRNASGFGALFKRPSDGKRGAIWVDRECLEAGNHCDRQFAHEVGHFFGLCHVCRLQGGKKKAEPWCPCVPSTLPSCHPGMGNSVMHPKADGTDLDACEQAQVETNAPHALGLP
jgi:hypothetical protein